MSNIIAKMKNRGKRLMNHEARDVLQHAHPKQSSINIGEYVLPRTLVVDVKKETATIGNTTDKIRDIPPNYTLTDDFESVVGFIAFLKSLSADDIDKVILDNGTDFKHRMLDEFTASIEAHVELIRRRQ